MNKKTIPLPYLEQSPSDKMLLSIGFSSKTYFNNDIMEDSSTQNFFYSLMGDGLSHWQFVQNIFMNRDDVQLTVFDKNAVTPFRCLLIALLIRQMRETLSLRYKSIQVLMNAMHDGHPGIVMADEKFDTTSHRNEFIQQAIARIVGQPFSFSCRRNHLRKSAILLSSDDFTLTVKVFPSLTMGWIMGHCSSSFLTAEKLLDAWQTDIPCYNQTWHEFEKNGIHVSSSLAPNKK